MTNDQCEQSTTVSLSISYSANLKYHDWSLGRRKCCGVFLSRLNILSHLATREAPDHEKRWDWKSQVLALDEDLSNIFLEDDMNNALITNL